MQPIAGSLAKEEREILAIKYILPVFSKTSAIDIGRQAKGLLVRLHTITGWKLPDDDLFLNTLVSEFSRYLTENCGDLNPEEVAYAFRNYALETQDWGKSMNLQLIHDPISRYRQVRKCISEMEERVSDRTKEGQKLIESPIDTDWSEQWYKIKESARNGTINSIFIVTPIYDWLKRTGRLTVSGEERKQILEDCRQAFALEMRDAIRESGAPNPEARKKYDLLVKEGDEWRENEDLWSAVINASKIKAVKIEAQNAVIKDQKFQNDSQSNFYQKHNIPTRTTGFI